eukprot:UN34448
MLQNSSWKSLTSPPYDLENALEVFGQHFGFKHYAFINLTGKQMKKLSLLIAATLKEDPEIALLFHFSGHGGHLKAKEYLKQCFMGIDATDNGEG